MNQSSVAEVPKHFGVARPDKAPIHFGVTLTQTKLTFTLKKNN